MPVGGKLGSGELDHPGGDGCREEQILSLRRPVFANVLKDFLDVFLETLFQHLICLVKASYLQVGELNGSPL